MKGNTFIGEQAKSQNKDYTNLTGTIRYRLTNDYMFRAVMQKNKNILKHLVCAILGIQPETVSELDICNPIVLGEEINAKSCILDIKVLLNNRQYLNIEMQVSKQNYWKQRSLTYLCKTYDSLDSGQNYDEALPAVQISILDFDLFDGIEELLSKYYLINENPKYHNHYSNDFAVYVLNLKQIHNKQVIQREADSELYQWAKLFQAKSWEEIHMLAEKNEIFDECIYTMAQLTEDEKIRMQCEAIKDNRLIENGIRKRAIQEGLKQGQEQSRKEIAKSLLDVLDIPTIAEKTGLTQEEVTALAKETT